MKTSPVDIDTTIEFRVHIEFLVQAPIVESLKNLVECWSNMSDDETTMIT